MQFYYINNNFDNSLSLPLLEISTSSTENTFMVMKLLGKLCRRLNKEKPNIHKNVNLHGRPLSVNLVCCLPLENKSHIYVHLYLYYT